MRGETTWVARGRGYELVGRTRSDLAAVEPALERSATFLAQIYPADSVAPIVAAIRREVAPGKPFVTAAPVPSDAKGAQVELVIVDPRALEEERKKKDGPPPEPMMMGMRGGLITPAVRAWLTARATHVTGTGARLDQSRGETDDPRVPAWAVEMVTAAGNDQVIDSDTKSLAAHAESLIPLSRYFTMERPGPIEMAGGRRGGAGGETPSEGRGGGMSGGTGGARGGMGGGRGGMGRGGMGGEGSRGNPGGSAERSFPLQGFALFSAESAVLSKYFSRTGSDVVGELIDAQITGKPIDDVITKHNLGSMQQVDSDWRNWLAERADLLTRR